MAKALRFGLLALASFLFIILAFRVASFVHLFYEHAGTALTQQQVAKAYYDSRTDLKKPPIPRIIHQIYHNWTDPSNEALPDDWRQTRQTCIDLNRNWDIRVSSMLGMGRVTL